METPKGLYKAIYKHLEWTAKNVGQVINEYNWRDVCGLMMEMENSGLVSRQEINEVKDELYGRYSGNDGTTRKIELKDFEGFKDFEDFDL